MNQLLSRPPGAPLDFERALNFQALKIPLDTLVDRAEVLRQEILEASLNERNSNTALQLAKMEYLPDFTVSYFFDHYLLASAAPAPNRTQDHSWVIGANMPIFFWLKQNEDVARAQTNLEASPLRPGFSEEPDRSNHHLALSLGPVRLSDGDPV